MSKFIAAIAVIIAGLVILQPSPSYAGDCTFGYFCGQVYHDTDAGYDPAIKVRCNYGNDNTIQYISEGQRSGADSKCGQYGNGDMDEIYIHVGEELWCWDNYKTYLSKEFDATGYHKVNDSWNKSCTLRQD